MSKLFKVMVRTMSYHIDHEFSSADTFEDATAILKRATQWVYRTIVVNPADVAIAMHEAALARKELADTRAVIVAMFANANRIDRVLTPTEWLPAYVAREMQPQLDETDNDD